MQSNTSNGAERKRQVGGTLRAQPTWVMNCASPLIMVVNKTIKEVLKIKNNKEGNGEKPKKSLWKTGESESPF